MQVNLVIVNTMAKNSNFKISFYLNNKIVFLRKYLYLILIESCSSFDKQNDTVRYLVLTNIFSQNI